MPNKLHSNLIFAAHFFSSACCRYRRIPTFSSTRCAGILQAIGTAKIQTHASPRLLTMLCTVAILIRPHPSFSTELKPLGTALRRSACVCRLHPSSMAATFQRVADHHEQEKQATHLAGGEEEGEGTSEDAHGWVLCGVYKTSTMKDGQGRRCWSLLVLFGRAARSLVCCWRGPPHHRLP